MERIRDIDIYKGYETIDLSANTNDQNMVDERISQCLFSRECCIFSSALTGGCLFLSGLVVGLVCKFAIEGQASQVGVLTATIIGTIGVFCCAGSCICQPSKKGLDSPGEW